MKRTILAAVLFFLSGTAHAQWAPGTPSDYYPDSNTCATLLTPFWNPCPGRAPDLTAPFHWQGGYSVFGRLDANSIAPDMALLPDVRYWGTQGANEMDGTPKLRARSLILTDLGDTPDIQLRATGPDRGDYNGEAQAFGYKGSPTAVAKIYGQVLAPDCYGNLSFVAGCGEFGRLGILEFGITDTPTATSRPSYMAFYNTPPGSVASRKDFYMANGQFMSMNAKDAANPAMSVPCGSQFCGLYGDAWGVKFSTWGLSGQLGGSGFNFPDNPNDTTLTLVVRKPGNIMETKAVSVGDANSCGSGYRCLRVEN